ncbi:hypothetical protein VF14_36675 [Nostoc linckia z18]|uniref:Uncharacterized protein n=2 Tax=Nostoc linckia TaxID=92942 RepID=A0A9Q6EGP2_NOSLI|nr:MULTISPECIES: hypothetical protein [Nostoc]PHK36355.1 hypothetical protein VF13_37135 [Nostoc linckia z16]PHK39236.1 hypothetical protein VF12_14905 [Nostoc linckia z15]MBC1235656.1 hypothetical protein [Nostoc sp. 2RC]PHJ56160.1 hypothetical protein VF03_37810 [Nostoc linckia z2]PHJ59255.1 hypothetical protein VF02_25575 [Nostoc linckia z1]
METLEATTNGTKAGLKADDKPKKQADKPKRHLPSLPSAISAADMNQVEYSGLADRTAVEWSSLQNYEMFSLSADGSFPMMKVSRSKAVRLADRQVMMVGSGRCFRVSLSNHPTQNKPQS